MRISSAWIAIVVAVSSCAVAESNEAVNTSSPVSIVDVVTSPTIPEEEPSERLEFADPTVPTIGEQTATTARDTAPGDVSFVEPILLDQDDFPVGWEFRDYGEIGQAIGCPGWDEINDWQLGSARAWSDEEYLLQTVALGRRDSNTVKLIEDMDLGCVADLGAADDGWVMVDIVPSKTASGVLATRAIYEASEAEGWQGVWLVAAFPDGLIVTVTAIHAATPGDFESRDIAKIEAAAAFYLDQALRGLPVAASTLEDCILALEQFALGLEPDGVWCNSEESAVLRQRWVDPN